ncbi:MULTISPECIES: GNAT family N-acetyltransferase [Bacillaceae]|uniref:GNAT family N-acetyltransferase n=1 Tax=Bacillaceae TaxID=186817 RepID=UPI000BA528BF|nr:MULTISPECIES: GNAT family N-acetyltransferase [Bacillaceae]PAE26146.1 GNAT family N-acetyltransferase [Bacillus sp. 7894-2]URM31039.1 GNAT family N-acetyltransferase [Cytobacillus firmus]
MIIKPKQYIVKNLSYTIRSAVEEDAKKLSEVRAQIDGETENMDREAGEGYIDETGFRELVNKDSISERNIFLVAEVNGRIAGFSRCEGSELKRSRHKVEFGVCVLNEFWGFAIGKNLLAQSIQWAEANHIKKITLYVLETNEKAIKLYEQYGFEIEGVLKMDKLLSDGNYYSTMAMGRITDNNCCSH